MKPNIIVTHQEGNAEQEFALHCVDGFMLEDIRYSIYESSNFFGHPVTLGVEELRGTDSSDREHFQVTVKATICSKEDTYKPELGRAIVLGRLMKSEKEGLQLTNISDDDERYLEVVESYVHSMATKLKDYLLTRDSMMELHNMSRTVGLRTLSEEFKEFT